MLAHIFAAPNALANGSRLRALVEVSRAPKTHGTVLRSGADLQDPEMRLCSVAHVEHTPLPALLQSAFMATAREVAGDVVDQLVFDGPMFVSYPAGGMFRAHRDVSEDPADPEFVRNRKFTMVCFLNDHRRSDHYPSCEGGALVVYRPAPDGAFHPVSYLPEAGQIVVFDSTLLHEVRPVLRGERVTAVAWLYQQGVQPNG